MAKKQVENNTAKEYLKSSLITFIAAFGMAVLPGINDLTLETVKSGALVSLGFTGLRAAFKAVIEYLLAWYAQKK